MDGKHKYTRAIIAFATAFALFLVGMDLLLVLHERKQLNDEFDNQAKNELSLIGTFVTESLLEQQYAVVEQFILQWGEENPGILEINALSPQGYSLAQFKRPSTQENFRSFRHSVDFMNRNILGLEIIKDVSPVELHLQETWKHLILQSLIVLAVFGTILWFILKVLALKPLENEIILRQDAEHNLQKAHDLLEIKVKERTSELASEKERLAVTLRSIGDGVITTNIVGEIVLMNKIAETLTGWTYEEVEGQPIENYFNIVNVATREPCESPVNLVLRTGEVINPANLTALVARDGSEKIISDSGAPIKDKDSRIIGVVLVFRDITDHLHMEQELLKVKKLESVGVLAGGIAHDFNNILAGIMGNISLAMVYVKPEEEKIHKLLHSAEKASMRAKDLTQQLLTFSKGGEPIKSVASIDEVIKDSASFVLRGSHIRCEYTFPEGLWLVEIDTGQISQVIQNIIINASHATPDGGVIDIRCENFVNDKRKKTKILSLSSGEFISITIQDRGVGIPSDILDRIFDPYFSTKQKGSGLGLAITHSIINKHNGHIAVDSKQGVGSTFTIYLPAVRELKTDQPQSSLIVEYQGNGKILVMDDEIIVREIAQEIISHIGFEVKVAVGGKEAIEIYKKSLEDRAPFDVIIMDLTIPGGMGGKEAVKEILTLNPKAKVIVASGYSSDPVMANYKDYGFSGVLPKPFTLENLQKTISKVIAG